MRYNISLLAHRLLDFSLRYYFYQKHMAKNYPKLRNISKVRAKNQTQKLKQRNRIRIGNQNKLYKQLTSQKR